MRHDWNQCYASGDTPWDSGAPDHHLVELVESGELLPGRALEIGCGTGANALWLASKGFEVLGVDIAPLAIERARARAAEAGTSVNCRFEQLDIVAETPSGAPFDFVFDRGCFHLFDEAAVRARFAARVAGLLGEGGVWLSLIGSSEGPPRDQGPPRRSASQLVAAIEPVLRIERLRLTAFDDTAHELPPAAWFCLASRRSADEPQTF